MYMRYFLISNLIMLVFFTSLVIIQRTRKDFRPNRHGNRIRRKQSIYPSHVLLFTGAFLSYLLPPKQSIRHSKGNSQPTLNFSAPTCSLDSTNCETGLPLDQFDTCSDCNTIYCPFHSLTNIFHCTSCNKSLCYSHISICASCDNTFCDKHLPIHTTSEGKLQHCVNQLSNGKYESPAKLQPGEDGVCIS